MKAAGIYENRGARRLRLGDLPPPDPPRGVAPLRRGAGQLGGGDRLAPAGSPPPPRPHPGPRLGGATSREGRDLPGRAGSPPPSAPRVVGYLAGGTSAEIGAAAGDRAVGDRVVTLNAAGSHAARRAVPAASTWPVPDGVDAAPAA